MEKAQKVKPLTTQGLEQLFITDMGILYQTEALLDEIVDMLQKPSNNPNSLIDSRQVIQQLIDYEEGTSQIDELINSFDTFTYEGFLNLNQEEANESEQVSESDEKVSPKHKQTNISHFFNNVIFPTSEDDPLYSKQNKRKGSSLAQVPPPFNYQQLQVANQLLRTELIGNAPFSLNNAGNFIHVDQLNTLPLKMSLLRILNNMPANEVETSEVDERGGMKVLKWEIEELEKVSGGLLAWTEFFWAQNALKRSEYRRLRGFYAEAAGARAWDALAGPADPPGPAAADTPHHNASDHSHNENTSWSGEDEVEVERGGGGMVNQEGEAPPSAKEFQKLLGLLRGLDECDVSVGAALLAMDGNSQPIKPLQHPIWRLQRQRLPSFLAVGAGALFASLWDDVEFGGYGVAEEFVNDQIEVQFSDDSEESEDVQSGFCSAFNVQQFHCQQKDQTHYSRDIVPQIHYYWNSGHNNLKSIFDDLQLYKCKVHAARDDAARCDKCEAAEKQKTIPKEAFAKCYGVQ